MKNFPDEGKPRKLRFSWALWWATVIVSAMAACAAKGAPAIPAQAVVTAAEDWQQRGKNPLLYYLWSPTASDSEYNAASVAINLVINQGSVEYIPQRVAGGALVMMDLEQLVDNSRQLERLQLLLLELAQHDAYFAQSFSRVIHADKKTKEHVESFTSTATHTGADGKALGLARMFRLDQFVKLVTSSADDGFYLKFRGLEVGKTKLDDYLEKRGFSRKNSKSDNAIDELLMTSLVTGKVRAVFLIQGQKTKASVGRSLCTITGDVADGPLDPHKNVFKSVFNEEFDAFEVIVTLPNGHQEFTLWNGKGLLLAEADQKVVTDHTVPPPFGNRLQSMHSCVRCHSEGDGYQDINNSQRMIVQPDLRLTNEQGTITFNADVTKFFADPIEGKRVALSRFGARQKDVTGAINDARESLNRRFDVVRAPRIFDPNADLRKDAHSCKQAYLNMAEVYNDYAYKWVTPAMACQELGFDSGQDPKETLRQIAPAPNAKGYIAEGSANTLGQLRAGNSVTRDDFEQAYAELELKAVESLRQSSANQKFSMNTDRKVDPP